jgi:hypothetical protein
MCVVTCAFTIVELHCLPVLQRIMFLSVWHSLQHVLTRAMYDVLCLCAAGHWLCTSNITSSSNASDQE